MSTDLICIPPPITHLPVTGDGLFPVGRIFCIGKNYADHAVEMGSRPDTPPVFFMKAVSALAPPGTIDFPNGTQDLHYEGEMVVALGAEARPIAIAAGCDLTKRDLQKAAKDAGGPWEVAKAFDGAALVGPLRRLTGPIDPALQLESCVNGTRRQSAPISAMTLSVDEILKALNAHFKLMPGDLIFTGTPAGVGKLEPGDAVEVSVTGCAPLRFCFSAP